MTWSLGSVTVVGVTRRGFWLLALVVIGVLALPVRCPAPLVYRPGEGWAYESAGGAKWARVRAEAQMDVAREAFDKRDYVVARKAARRTVNRWPLSDYAPEAQYMLGRVCEERRHDEKAFKEYQKLIERYPKAENFGEVLRRQYTIANRFLGGQRFRLWGLFPFFRSMERTAEMFAKIIRNGPYTDLAPEAQLRIGKAREKQHDYVLAAKAYEKAADVYHDNEQVAAEGMYRAGKAYLKQAQKAEYDQSAAGSAIATFTDFAMLYPKDKRIAETHQVVASLKTEQARGAFQIAQFYEKKRKWDGAKVYYNEAVSRDPNSTYAAEARRRLEVIAKRGRGRVSAKPPTEP